MHRKVFFPHTHVTAGMITTSVVGAVLLFVVGWAVFIRLEKPMLKEL
jgi:hypothetical protein